MQLVLHGVRQLAETRTTVISPPHTRQLTPPQDVRSGFRAVDEFGKGELSYEQTARLMTALGFFRVRVFSVFVVA